MISSHDTCVSKEGRLGEVGAEIKSVASWVASYHYQAENGDMFVKVEVSQASRLSLRGILLISDGYDWKLWST